MSPIQRNFIRFDWDMKDTLKEIERMTANLDTVSPLAIDEYGEVLTDSIRSFTPRKTGESQASIGKFDASLVDESAAPGATVRARMNAVYMMRRIRKDTWELVVGTNSERVVWLNYGTQKMRAHHMFERGQVAALPYLRPAVQAAIDASVRPSGWITEGRWTSVRARSNFTSTASRGVLRKAKMTKV